MLMFVLVLSSCSQKRIESKVSVNSLFTLKTRKMTVIDSSLERFANNRNMASKAVFNNKFKPYVHDLPKDCKSFTISGPRRPALIVSALLRKMGDEEVESGSKVFIDSVYDRYAKTLYSTLVICKK